MKNDQLDFWQTIQQVFVAVVFVGGRWYYFQLQYILTVYTCDVVNDTIGIILFILTLMIMHFQGLGQ